MTLLWRWTMIRWILPGVAFMNLAYGPFFVMSAAWSQQILHRGSFGYSMLVLAESLGNLIGGLSSATVQRRFPGVLPWVTGMLVATAVAIFPGFSNLWIDFLSLLLFGVGTGMVNTLFLTLLQQRVPDEQRGRVFATIGTIFGSTLPLGTALAGIGVASVGLHGLFWIAALTIAGAAIYLGLVITLNPVVRRETLLSAAGQSS
jgi:MFS family permease